MNCNKHKDNINGFRVLTELSREQFSAHLPCFKEAHKDYSSTHEMNGKRHSGRQRASLTHRNASLPAMADRLFLFPVYLRNTPL